MMRFYLQCKIRCLVALHKAKWQARRRGLLAVSAKLILEQRRFAIEQTKVSPLLTGLTAENHQKLLIDKTEELRQLLIGGACVVDSLDALLIVMRDLPVSELGDNLKSISRALQDHLKGWDKPMKKNLPTGGQL